MTEEGQKKLLNELKHLKTVERPIIIKAIADARSNGDLSENAEYHAAREKQSFIEGRVAEIESIIAQAELIDVSKLSGTVVKFGATVSIINLDNDKESKYQLVGEVEADIIVSATGLALKFFGGVAIQVDNTPVLAKDTMTYKGMMFSGVPNFALSSGYTNASWTLKCDLTSAYVCRLLNHMDKKGYAQARPQLDRADIEVAPLLDFTSGYVVRKLDELPKQGTVTPWRMHQNYLFDIMMLRMGRVTDGMKFSGTEKST